MAQMIALLTNLSSTTALDVPAPFNVTLAASGTKTLGCTSEALDEAAVRGAPAPKIEINRLIRTGALSITFTVDPLSDAPAAAPVQATVITNKVLGGTSNLLLAPDADGGLVAIVKADGTTKAFESNATGTAVNGATPVAKASAITAVGAAGALTGADTLSLSGLLTVLGDHRTAINALITAVKNFGITA
jgi:hypothetical protein